MSKPISKNNSRTSSPSPIPPTERDSLLNSNSNSNQNSNQNQNVNRIVVDPAPEEEEKDSSILVAAFAAMLVFQLGNRIFGKLMCYPMYNYALFISVLSTFIYIPATFIYIIPTQLFTNNIAVEQTQISKYKFGVMGFFDTVAGIMSQFAVNYISNASMIVLVQQSAIPISMCISSYLLQAKYTTSQYVGAGIVLLGIVVVLAPSFLSPTPVVPMDTGDGGDTTGGTANQGEMLWIVMLVFSCIPMCLSSVYKEKVCFHMYCTYYI